MTTYIAFGAGLQILAVAYIVSALVLIAASYIGWAVIETIEESSKL